jgi:myo-inositol-1(or 4)-monophosphatase
MRPEDIAARFEAAQAIACEAGRLARRLRAGGAPLEIEAKGEQDFVTAADRAVEQLIRERLAAAFPGDGFLGEESGITRGASAASPLWVVDPIDGTSNFIRGAFEWCVSIGLLVGERPVIGVIYDPNADELFAASADRGATCNGLPIRVSERTSLAGATVAIEFSFDQSAPTHAAQVQGLLERGSEYRRNGSAALSLAHVACGRLDAFFELDLSAWDVVAGMALVAEAGGWVSDFLADDGLSRGNAMLAAAPALRQPLTEIAALGTVPLR